MDGTMSQEEINALLNNPSGTDENPENTLTEQEKIPVLDFSSKGNENVIIKQGDKTTVKKPENKEGVLRRTDGKISRASGVIVRK